MDNKQTMTLRRHNTSPSSSAGRSVIAPVSVGRRITRDSFLGYRSASMKSNPYVGCFRHAPPTSPRTALETTPWRTNLYRKTNNAPWCSVPASLKACKNSPHIGWFRHAPPSRLNISSTMTPTSSLKSNDQDQVLREQEELLVKLLQELNPALDNGHLRKDIQMISQACQQVIVSGRLPGGGKDYLERTRSYKKDFRESSAEGTLSTVNTLSSLASWFLFPLAHDAESCGYRQDQQQSPKRKRKKNRKSKEEGLLSQLSPYLPTFLEEPPLDIPKKEYEKYGDMATRQKDQDRDDSGSSDSDCVAPSTIASPSTPSSMTISTKDLSLSVSSLAEAYYAHHQTTIAKDTSPISHEPLTPSASVLDPSSISPHQLDYVITQMDIARMTRNASRHLDVQSILGLPVITYHDGASTRMQSAPRAESQRQGGWSWTIVEETEGQKENSVTECLNDEKIDFCVICLEHFVNGDRLRVLPCDHSFVSTQMIKLSCDSEIPFGRHTSHISFLFSF